MFTNTLFFIIVFALFAFSEPDAAAEPAMADLLGIPAVYIAFFIAVRIRFELLEKSLSSGSSSAAASSHGSCVTRCMVLAAASWAVLIYVFNLTVLLSRLPGFSASDLLKSASAAALFFAFLLIIWHGAFPSYRRFLNSSGTLRGYLVSQLRFNSALVAPWLIFSAVIDAAGLLPGAIKGFISAHAAAEYGLIAAIFAMLCVFFPALLVRLWGCKPLQPGPVRQRVDDFCKRAGLAFADILVWNLFEGKLITAGVLGFVSRFRYILISPALLQLLDHQELEAVIAHEIGHVKRRHMFFYLLFILGYTFFAYVFYSALLYGILSSDVAFDFVFSDEGRPGTLFSLLSMMILTGVLLLYFRLLFGLFSRNFERQADGYSWQHTGSGRGIIQSLEKIAYAGSQSRTSPNWHHFSIQQRVDFMRRCDTDPGMIRRHDRKVRGLILSYCGALLLLVGLYAGYGSAMLGDSELAVLEKITQRRIDADPGNPMLYFALGNICFEKKHYGDAIRGYEAALRLQPENAEVLNNLAWLYATAQDASWRDPAQALKLSLKAVALDPKPHILDTLAESYFLNGNIQAALSAIDLAIAQQPPNQRYFEQQRRKFQQHLPDAGREDEFDPDEALPYGTTGVSI